MPALCAKIKKIFYKYVTNMIGTDPNGLISSSK